VAVLVALTFVAMSSSAIAESGVDALFFDRIGPDALPQVYLLQAASTFVAMLALAGVLGRLGHRRAYLAAPLALAVVALAERAVLLGDARWIYPALWVTAALATLVLGVALWGTAGAVLDTRQAKRLFPIVGGGGILGSVVGGLLTRPLAAAIGAENLLLVWVAGLVTAFALARVALGPHAPGIRRATRRPRSALRDLAGGLAFVRRSRLLAWMAVAAVLFSVLFYSLYLPFAQAAAERFPDADRLAGFFGVFWASVTGAAFVFSMLITNRLFAWLGIAAMIVVLPLLYSASFAILLVESGFATLVALRFVNGVWLQGVASPGWETLVNVVPEARRDQTRAFLNGGPSQIGTAIAGVVALVGQDILSLRQFAIVGLVAAALTVFVAVAIRRSYTDALVDALRAGRPQVFDRPSVHAAPILPTADAEATAVLATASRAPDVRLRRLALELAAGGRAALPLDDVRAGLVDTDPLVRLAAVRALWDHERAERHDLLPLLQDRDHSVRAAAAAASLASHPDRADPVLRAAAADPDPAVRGSVVGQLDLAPTTDAVRYALALCVDPDAKVRSAAIERLAASAPDVAFDVARTALGDDEPAVRLAAGRALGAIGPRSIEPAFEALDDPRTAAAAIEILRRVRVDAGAERVASFVRRTADRAAGDAALAADIPHADDATALLRDAVLDRGRRTALAALWAASTATGRRDAVRTAIGNLDAGPAQLANALETLESAGIPEVRTLVSLWEPRRSRPTDGDGWLVRTLADDDDVIRACATLVRARRQARPEGGTMALSTIERVLLLRRVPLFAGLAPADLERVAEVAEELSFGDGEVIADEGELGEELYIVIEGTIHVVRDRDGDARTLARRTEGDVVGEMSLITRSPRVASLLADRSVHTLRIGRREFESMLRERPDVALGVMRVLADRLGERSGTG
jgi:HEAT repeat protein